MKKITSIITILCTCFTASAFALNDFTPFTTVEQAEQNCPAANSLTFTPANRMQNGAGTINGTNRVVFESITPKAVVRPKNLNASNLVLDAAFRGADGIYGYISGAAVTCLYTYTTIVGAKYPLVLRGK